MDEKERELYYIREKSIRDDIIQISQGANITEEEVKQILSNLNTK